jgi:TIR domain
LAVWHLFICFSSKDETVARQVVDFLEAEGLTCWISSRDVLPGQNYQEAIVQAIERANGIVFLFSEWSSKSGEIRKELSIGGSINLPVFPLRLSQIAPTGALRYELATRQWIDIFPNRTQALGKLAETIRHAIAGGAAEQDAAPRHRSDLHTHVPAARAPIVAVGSPEFEAIRTLLARYIGPIAKVYVEKAASEAHTPDAFCELLSAHVAAPSERTAFLQAARARLTAKP